MKFCVFCANLHSGGGVQVAASFLAGLAVLSGRAARCTVFASTEVDRNLRQMVSDVSVFGAYTVEDYYGLSALWSSLSRRFQPFDAVFTVFGPLYLLRKPRVSVVGFAQPWIIYPDNEIQASQCWLRRAFTRLKFAVQAWFFRRADQLVVELDHVKQGLVSRGIAPARSIRVVSNCLSDVFLQPACWLPVALPPGSGKYRIGFVGRNYPHKNVRILPSVRRLLRDRYGLDIEVYVTLNDQEWAASPEDFKTELLNVGALTLAQCPTFYRAMDAVVFPSLLECFSATPLEAMVMGRPLFASDRLFIRDVCGDFAHYFDPMDEGSAAATIAAYFSDGGKLGKNLDAAREHALAFSSNAQRTIEYIDCLESAVKP